MLKLNPDKMEFVMFGSKMQQGELKKFNPVNTADNSPSLADGMLWLNCDFSCSKHIQSILRAYIVSISHLK